MIVTRNICNCVTCIMPVDYHVDEVGINRNKGHTISLTEYRFMNHDVRLVKRYGK